MAKIKLYYIFRFAWDGVRYVFTVICKVAVCSNGGADWLAEALYPLGIEHAVYGTDTEVESAVVSPFNRTAMPMHGLFAVTTRMTPALRWAAMRAVLMFH